jgi:hypothetical protein
MLAVAICQGSGLACHPTKKIILMGIVLVQPDPCWFGIQICLADVLAANCLLAGWNTELNWCETFASRYVLFRCFPVPCFACSWISRPDY